MNWNELNEKWLILGKKDFFRKASIVFFFLNEKNKLIKLHVDLRYETLKCGHHNMISARMPYEGTALIKHLKCGHRKGVSTLQWGYRKGITF